MTTEVKDGAAGAYSLDFTISAAGAGADGKYGTGDDTVTTALLGSVTSAAIQTLSNSTGANTLDGDGQTASTADGWVTIRGGQAIPEGGNDVTFVFGEGVTVNGGLTEVTIKMD